MPAHSKFDQTLFDAICERMANGEPLAVICRDPDVGITRRTFNIWCKNNPELAALKAEAREEGEEVILESVLPIVDDRSEDPASRKVRAWGRFELLKRLNPKKYGDKVQHGGAADLPPIRTERALTDEELEAIARGAAGG